MATSRPNLVSRSRRHWMVSPAQRNDQTMARVAVAWVLRRPEVTAAIVGARHPSQIEETVEAADWALTDDEVDEIESLLEKRERRLAA